MRYNKIYSFSRLIDKYTVDFLIQLNDYDAPTTEEYDDLGNPIIPTNVPFEPFRAAIIPPSDKEIYQSGGAITSSDRIMYVKDVAHPLGFESLPPKTKVKHKGKTYFIEGDADFLDFADFYKYVLKGVAVFD